MCIAWCCVRLHAPSVSSVSYTGFHTEKMGSQTILMWFFASCLPPGAAPLLTSMEALEKLNRLRLFQSQKPSFMRFLETAPVAQQFPANCGDVRIHVLRNWPLSSGLGSEIHTLAHTVGTAWKKGFTFVLHPQWHWGWFAMSQRILCRRRSISPYQCLFVPFSNCTTWVVQNRGAPNVRMDMRLQLFGAERAPPEDVLALKTLLRPSSEFVRWLLNKYVTFWYGQGAAGAASEPQSLIAVYIRLGDKILESSLLSISQYVDKVQSLVEKRHIRNPVILLSSEDANGITLFREVACPNSSCLWPVVVYNYRRPSLNCSQASAATLKYKRVLKSANTSKIVKAAALKGQCPSLQLYAAQQRLDIGLIALLNLFLALECRYVVCLFSSNWCRLLLELGLQGT